MPQIDKNDKIIAIADNLADYIWEKRIKPALGSYVSFYRAEVTAAAENGKIKIQRPFSAPFLLPYAGSAGGLKVGEQCLVLEFGSSSNAVIVGKVDLSNL